MGHNQQYVEGQMSLYEYPLMNEISIVQMRNLDEHESSGTMHKFRKLIGCHSINLSHQTYNTHKEK